MSLNLKSVQSWEEPHVNDELLQPFESTPALKNMQPANISANEKQTGISWRLNVAAGFVSVALALCFLHHRLTLTLSLSNGRPSFRLNPELAPLPDPPPTGRKSRSGQPYPDAMWHISDDGVNHRHTLTGGKDNSAAAHPRRRNRATPASAMGRCQ